MYALFSSLAPFVGVLAFMNDIDGFLVGDEMATILAGLLSTIFAGLANAFIGVFFSGGS